MVILEHAEVALAAVGRDPGLHHVEDGRVHGPLVACPLKRTNVCLYGSGGRAAPMARAYQLISADSHILEPPHLWRQYMPRKFHDKAPTVVPDGEGGEAWQFARRATGADRHLRLGGTQAR